MIKNKHNQKCKCKDWMELNLMVILYIRVQLYSESKRTQNWKYIKINMKRT